MMLTEYSKYKYDLYLFIARNRKMKEKLQLRGGFHEGKTLLLSPVQTSKGSKGGKMEAELMIDTL